MDQSPCRSQIEGRGGDGVARDKWDPGLWDAPLTDQLHDF